MGSNRNMKFFFKISIFQVIFPFFCYFLGVGYTILGDPQQLWQILTENRQMTTTRDFFSQEPLLLVGWNNQILVINSWVKKFVLIIFSFISSTTVSFIGNSCKSNLWQLFSPIILGQSMHMAFRSADLNCNTKSLLSPSFSPSNKLKQALC